MSAIPSLHQQTTQDRENARAFKVYSALERIVARAGAPSAGTAQISALSALAEVKAVWICLEEKGFVTPAAVQTYLDRGVDQLLKQVDERLGRISVDVAG